MIKKKNGFWAFVFSLLPGAGEMYMGFFKQGVSLMGMFFLIIFMASWLNIGPLLFVIPIVWFYGFFHVHNLRSMPDEEFYAMEDSYLFELDHILPAGKSLSKKARNVMAAVLILIGILVLMRQMTDMVYWLLPAYLQHWCTRIWYKVPQIIFAGLLIWLGFWLIRGKKQELDDKEQKEKAGDQP